MHMCDLKKVKGSKIHMHMCENIRMYVYKI